MSWLTAQCDQASKHLYIYNISNKPSCFLWKRRVRAGVGCLFFAVAEPASRMNISCNTQVAHTNYCWNPPKRFKAWRVLFFSNMMTCFWMITPRYQTWFPLGGSLIISTPLLATIDFLANLRLGWDLQWCQTTWSQQKEIERLWLCILPCGEWMAPLFGIWCFVFLNSSRNDGVGGFLGCGGSETAKFWAPQL